MSCYVDPLFVMESRDPQAHRVGAKHGHRWCHLWADTEAELHAMAEKIGMRRAWFQNKTSFPHYDLTPSRRKLALAHGAQELRLADWLRPSWVECPDCGEASKVHECRVDDLGLYGVMRDCPKCTVGSPIGSWKTVPAQEKANR